MSVLRRYDVDFTTQSIDEDPNGSWLKYEDVLLLIRSIKPDAYGEGVDYGQEWLSRDRVLGFLGDRERGS